MALREDSGKRKSMSDSLFRITIHHMKVMNHFLKDLQKLQISFGEHFRSFRRKREQKVEYLIWTQRSYHRSLHMMQVI